MRTRRFQSSDDPMPPQRRHRSVLLHECIDSLAIQKDDVVVDATLGGAGHAREIASQLGTEGVLIGVDADEEAIQRAAPLLHGSAAAVHLIRSNFRHIGRELERIGIAEIDKAILDLGWSSFQLTAGRGFSFLTDEPLSMAYDKSQAVTAYTVVNSWSEETLADIIYGFGEERFARRIAHAIVGRREEKAIETASELAEIVRGAVPAKARYGRIHPATKTFQAIRIAVNDELGALEEGLSSLWRRLASGGRIAVISFHSIEDRAVKRTFAQWEEAGEGKRITKKPIVPSEEELKENPRARSAKLRVIQKN